MGYKLNHLKVAQYEVAPLILKEKERRKLTWTAIARQQGAVKAGDESGSPGQSIRRYAEQASRSPLAFHARQVKWLNELPEIVEEAAPGGSAFDLDTFADAVAERVVRRLGNALRPRNGE